MRIAAISVGIYSRLRVSVVILYSLHSRLNMDPPKELLPNAYPRIRVWDIAEFDAKSPGLWMARPVIPSLYSLLTLRECDSYFYRRFFYFPRNRILLNIQCGRNNITLISNIRYNVGGNTFLFPLSWGFFCRALHLRAVHIFVFLGFSYWLRTPRRAEQLGILNIKLTNPWCLSGQLWFPY